MARKKKGNEAKVEDYRHEDAKRKNIPPAGLAARSQTIEMRKQRFFSNPEGGHYPILI